MQARQAQSSQGVSTTPILAGQLRIIGEGRPLESGVRRAMEAFFQADFSGVKVHEGTTAQAVGALAFTLGEDLHFAPGLYDPTSREGVDLLGHELTHVVQQREGRVANPYGQGVAIVQDPALEAEADRRGREVAEQLWSGPRAGRPSPLARTPWFAQTVQRSRKHVTKKGKVKDSTLDFLKQDKLTVKDLVNIWESLKKVFDHFAKTDSDDLPANTTGNLPDVLDLDEIQEEYYHLGKILSDGVGPALNSSRGDHANEEEKLPVYAIGTHYEEFGYLKGGGRLVVDHTSRRRYISLHYSTFYRIA